MSIAHRILLLSVAAAATEQTLAAASVPSPVVGTWSGENPAEDLAGGDEGVLPGTPREMPVLS